LLSRWVEDQQIGVLRACGVLPGQLTAGDRGDVRQVGIALLLFDEVAHVLADHQAAEALLQALGEKGLAAGFGAG
jgi:hypothetical protein